MTPDGRGDRYSWMVPKPMASYNPKCDAWGPLPLRLRRGEVPWENCLLYPLPPRKWTHVQQKRGTFQKKRLVFQQAFFRGYVNFRGRGGKWSSICGVLCRVMGSYSKLVGAHLVSSIPETNIAKAPTNQCGWKMKCPFQMAYVQGLSLFCNIPRFLVVKVYSAFWLSLFQSYLQLRILVFFMFFTCFLVEIYIHHEAANQGKKLTGWTDHFRLWWSSSPNCMEMPPRRPERLEACAQWWTGNALKN